MKVACVLAIGTLVCSSAARAVSERSEKPGLVPGVGMPTLEELGLTEADLEHPPAGFSFDVDEPAQPTTINKRTSTHRNPPTCATNQPCSYLDLNHAINYLANLDMNCSVTGTGAVDTVQYNTAYIFLGANQYGNATTPCKTVARFAHKVQNHCNFKQHGKNETQGSQFIPESFYSAKGFRPDNMTVFVDVLDYNSSSTATRLRL